MENLNILAALPEIVLLTAALAVLAIDLFISDERRNVTYVLTLATLVLTGGVTWAFLSYGTVTYAFGGMYVTDPMANVLKLFSILTVAVALVYAQSYARDRGLWKGELFTLTLFALLGILLMISANNLLVIYLGLELQALSLYTLVALRRDDARSSEAAMKYFVLGALASGFLLYGMSMLYGATGTLDINELADRIVTGQSTGRLTLVFGTVFVVAGLAFKLGAVPFHMWVPDVYQGAPTPVTLLIGSAPKLAAFAIAFRILVEGLLPIAPDWQQMLIVLAALSMIIGNVVAIAQTNIKRMLAYSTISHVGFILLGVLAGNAVGYQAAMFYTLTYVIMTTGAFGIVLLLSRKGFEADALDDYRGLNRRSPWSAFVMLLLMFGMAGVPPTVGFWAKVQVISAVLDVGLTWLAALAVLLSVIGAYYYLRIVKLMYFDEPTASDPLVANSAFRFVLGLNGLAVLALGLFPGMLLTLCAYVLP